MRPTSILFALILATSCAPSVEPSETTAPAEVSAAPETKPALTPEPKPTIETPPPSEAPTGPKPTRGTIALADFWSQGQAAAGGLSGSFKLRSISGLDLEIHFTDGVWEETLPPRGALAVVEVEVNGETLLITGGQTLHSRGDHTLYVERRGKRTLHVVDAATGDALSGLRVVSTSLVYPARFPEGAAHSVPIEMGSSPFALEPDWPSRIHVTVPGYTWGSIAMHGSLGGEPTIALEPSGSIEVRLTGELAQSGYRLRVRQEGVAIAELPADAERYLAFDSLPAGDYDLTVESGEWEWPCVHGSASASALVGERTECSLAIEPEPLPATVRVPISFAVAPEWDLKSCEVELRLLSGKFAGLPESQIYKYKKLALKPGEGGTFAFEQRLLPGRYEVTLLPAGRFHRVLDLDPGGLDDWKFTVAAPGTLNVRVTDAEGEPAALERIWWDFVATDGYPHGSGAANADGVYALRVPQTKIVLRSGDPNWNIEAREAQVGEETEVTLIATPADALLLVWEDESMNPLRLDPWWRPRLTPSPTGGVYMTRVPGGYRIALEEPGEYVLQLPPIDGFEPFPAQTIEVETGELFEVRVPSVRAK